MNNAKFKAYKSTVEVKMSNGYICSVITPLIADGYYHGWWECPTGYAEHGSVYYSEEEIDDNTIQPLDKYEFDFCDKNLEEVFKSNEANVYIDEIIEIKDVNWEVDEDSIDDNIDDCYE